jgi:signal transduction histidine kinase
MKTVDFEELFRASPYPHLVMDEHLVVIDVNDAFLKLVSVARSAIIGKYLVDLLIENSGYIELINYTEIKDLLETTQESGQPLSTTFMAEDGKAKPVFVIQRSNKSISVSDEANAGDNVGATEDSALATSLAEEIKNLQLTAQYKDEFLSHLSHELRNPVSSINAAAEILSIAQPDPARLQKMTDVIKRQINLLVGLIDDLSDVSHFAKGLVSSDMRLVDVKHLIAEALEQNNTIIRARNHNVELESELNDFYIIADHKRMLQVLKNLLSNSAKYTPQGGNIRIKLNSDKEQVVINVIDDGSGIAPDVLPKVFDLFGRASQSTDHLNHGLGIGLAVVKNIVEQHSGSVCAFSEEGVKGSRFEIRLPAAAYVKS